ncbi:rod shape-determining protein [Nonomuraea sp. B10E15]|uniref:rod shape-determining protein n=1 Tax=Nonomuraea sp. B10E15 TaxID=3153560 RepID=UPI00325C9DC7
MAELASARTLQHTRHGRVALDLGTARTRALTSSGVAIADRPSAVVASPPVADVADPVRPIRHGMIADPGACLRLVRLVLRDVQTAGDRSMEQVVVGVPVAASPSDRRAVRTAVSEAAGCGVTLVEEPLAAAVGVGLDVTGSRPFLLLDVGAGIVEAVAIRDGAISDAVAIQLGATTSAGLLPYVLDGVVDMTAALLRRLPAQLRVAARAHGLTVTGGGALQAQLLSRLDTVLRMPVSTPPEPQHVTVRGLMRLCLQPALAAGLAARGR